MLNETIRLVRVFHDLSQKDVATRTGLSKSYISDLEAGNKRVTLDTLNKYAEAFDIPTSSLMLFSEQIERGSVSDDVRSFIADKALKMLSWIATISEDREKTLAEKNG
jgi:transcriptional regulator with XRE-family HTH domain